MTEHKVNVVQVTQYLNIGGLESFILEFCKKLNPDLYNIRVLCFEGYDEKYRNTLLNYQVPVHVIQKKWKYDFPFFFRVAAFLRQHRTHIVHTHGGCYLYSTIAGKLAGVKHLIYTVHGLPVLPGLKSNIEDYLSSIFTDRIITVSESVADNLKSRVRGFDEKIETILNGVDTATFKPTTDPQLLADLRNNYQLPPDAVIVGSVGRLESVKNYPMLLMAISEIIHRNNLNVRIILVGSGSEESHLRELAGDLSISQNVIFLGMQYDLPRIYPLFDIFALSSRTEGTSLSLLEAQSSGIPAVVTDVGGNATIIQDGINGFLCRLDDPSEMAGKLCHLIQNKSDRARMGRSAREMVLRKFNLDSMILEYQRIYMDCLGRTPSEINNEIPARHIIN